MIDLFSSHFRTLALALVAILSPLNAATDITIDSTQAASIVADLNAGIDVTISTSSAGADLGDITVDSPLIITNTTNAGTLTLIADNNILVNQVITSSQFFPIGEKSYVFRAGNTIIINANLSCAISSSNFGIVEIQSAGSLAINNSVDSGSGPLQINVAGTFTLNNNIFTGEISRSGADASIKITTNGNFTASNGSRILTFGETHTIIDAGQFTNNSGANLINNTPSSSGSGYFNILLFSPSGNTFGGLNSGNQAVYGSLGNSSPSQNEYHFRSQPILQVKMHDDSKIYGVEKNTFVGASIDNTGLTDASAYGNVFTQDTFSNSIDNASYIFSSSGLTSTADVGTYPIGSSGLTSPNGYRFNYIDGILTVNKRPITLSPSTQTKDYGDSLSLVQSAFTIQDLGDSTDNSLPNGEIILSVSLSSSGNIHISTDADAGRYANILSITSPNSTTQGSNGFQRSNYTITGGTGDLVISPRAITLIGSTQRKAYGDSLSLDDTAFTVLDKDGNNSLPNAETITNVSISSSTGVDGSTTADASQYSDEISIESPISGSAGSGDGFNESNYDITFQQGDLVVEARNIELTATNQSKVYGESLSLNNRAFLVRDKDGDAALPNGEIINTVSLSSLGGHDSSSTSDAHTYTDDITISGVSTGGSGFDASNYSITSINGNLTISKRPVTLTANDQKKPFGVPLSLDNTAVSVTDNDGDSSLPNNEQIATVSISSATGVDNSTTVDAGTYSYEIEIGTPVLGSNGLNPSNYLFSFEAGNLIVELFSAEDISLRIAPSNLMTNDVTLNYDTSSGFTYQLYRSVLLNGSDWTLINTYTGDGSTTSYTDTNIKPVHEKVFYQVRVTP